MRAGVAVWAAGLVLAGCTEPQDGGAVSRFLSGTPDAGTESETRAAMRQAEAAESPIIAELQARRSLLPRDSAYDRIAGPVLAANSRAAESDLRSARLRASAANKNWLPRIGPNISLTSLSDVVAQIIVEQVLFDNGRKRAERAFAKADVEAAAVLLADDTNERVLTALSLYLRAAQARERVTLETRTRADMAQFEWIMSERVRGGVSDMSDLHVIRAKLSEIDAILAAQAEAAATALAELNTMSTAPLDLVTGVPALAVSPAQATALEVLLAEAEKERDIAQATMERAGLLPGLSAGGTLGDDASGLAVNIGSEQLLGLGTPASLRAIEAEKEAAARRVAQAQEDSNRKLARLEQRAAALERQLGEAASLTAQAKSNLDLFQRQYDGGQRQVMDVVGVYESFAARQASQLALKYDLALTQLELARELGLLADGSEI